MNITFDAALWLLPFCIIGGFGLAALLYFREKNSGLSRQMRVILFFIRGLWVSLLAILILGPLLQISIQKEEKPMLFIAIDNSFSMISAKDSVVIKQELPAFINQIHKELSDRYEVKSMLFGDHLRSGGLPDFSDRLTNFGQVFEEVSNTSTNTAAIVIISDGILNAGSNPVYQGGHAMIPVYAIATGDTIEYADQKIDRVLHNRISLPGARIPVEINISSTGMKGQTSSLKVFENGVERYSKKIFYSSERSSISVPVDFEASGKGLTRFSVVLSQEKTEKNRTNNRYDFYIDIAENRSRILLLARAPHPDLEAIQSVLKENPGFQVEVALLKDFKKTLEDFDVVILHALPSIDEKGRAICEKLQARGIPTMYILSQNISMADFNSQSAGIQLSGDLSKTFESQAIPSLNFSSFALSDQLIKQIRQWPPLVSPSVNYQVSPGTSVLLTQKISGIETSRPLMTFSTNPSSQRRTVVICGEGIWWWRLKTYSIGGNHELFNELFGKAVQYLVVRDQGGRFKIKSKPAIDETELMVFEAELYNSNYEAVNIPDISMKIIDTAGHEYPFNFSRSGLFYSLEAGRMPAGVYRWEASTQFEDSIHRKNGFITVKSIQIEGIQTVANHHFLNQLSSNGGKMYGLSDGPQLMDDLLNRKDIKPIIYTEKHFTDAASFLWLLVLLLVLMITEWALRRRGGSL